MTSVDPIALSVVFSELGPGEVLELDGSTLRLPPKTIGNVSPPLDVTRASVSYGAYGSIGGAEVTMSILGQPFAQEPGGFTTSCRKHPFVGVDISITADNSTLTNPDTSNGQPVKLFTGYVDEPSYTLQHDELTISCRDRAALIVENDIGARAQQNRTVYAIVTEIAAEMGDTTAPLVSTSQAMQQLYGTLINQQPSAIDHRISGWAYLQKVAKRLGYVTYPTPTGLLYFGPRIRTDLSPILLVWGGSSSQGDLLTLSVQHTPARDGLFHVQVMSHDPTSGQNIQKTASYVNPDYIAFTNYSGPVLAQGLTFSQFSTAVGQVQVYNFFGEGASAQAAQNEAMGHALDIISHEFVLRGTMPGNTQIQVGQPVIFSNTGIDQVDQGQFFIAGVSQRVSIGQGEGESEGFLTEFIAWQQSPSGT